MPPLGLDLEQLLNGLLAVLLGESEVLIHLVLHDLAENQHIVVVLPVLSDRIDDAGCPLQGEVLAFSFLYL